MGEICAAMNRLIGGVRHILFKVQDDYMVNLVKGYLQNLFLVFYDLTVLDVDDWLPRLRNIDYSMLTIPDNLDSLFGVGRFVSLLMVDDVFFKFFERFYTCILGLIMRSERFKTTEVAVWKFVFDLYSIHFIFMKTRCLNMYCRRVMNSLQGVSSENILLRYVALVRNVPVGHLVYGEIKFSL